MHRLPVWLHCGRSFDPARTEVAENECPLEIAGGSIYSRRCCAPFELNFGNTRDNPDAQLRDNPRRLGAFYQRGRMGGASIGRCRGRSRKPVRRGRNGAARDVHPGGRAAGWSRWRGGAYRGRTRSDRRRTADAVHGGVVRDGRCGARVSQAAGTNCAEGERRGRAAGSRILHSDFFVPAARGHNRDGRGTSPSARRRIADSVRELRGCDDPAQARGQRGGRARALFRVDFARESDGAARIGDGRAGNRGRSSRF